MCSLKMIIVCCLFISVVAGQTSIVFPEVEEDSQNANKDHRQPVFSLATCPEGELYYPGDQKDDWMCDCMPRFLYDPATNRCWPAYRNGPCEAGHYLVLKKKSVIPFCERNPCFTDGYVIYNGRCELLGSKTPCKYLYPDIEALTVNSTTLAINCERIRIASRF